MAGQIDRDDMLSKATRFDMGGGVTVERRRHDGDRWVVCARGDVMNRAGEWEYEPQPSSRTDEFLARTRFDLEVAWTMARRKVPKY